MTIRSAEANPRVQPIHGISDQATTLLDRNLDEALRFSGFELGCILWMDSDRERLVVAAQQGMSAGWVDQTNQLQVGAGITGQAASDDQVMVVQDLSQEPRVLGRDLLMREGVRSFASIPLHVRGQTAGVLHVASRRFTKLSSTSLRILVGLCAQLSLAIENLQPLSELRRQEAVTQSENYSLRRAMAIQHALSQQALGGCTLEQIADALAQLVGNPGFLLSRQLQLLVSSANSAAVLPRWETVSDTDLASGAIHPRIAAATDRAVRTGRPTTVPPIVELGFECQQILSAIWAGKETLGIVSILVSQRPLDDIDVLAIDQAVNAFAIAMVRERAALEAELRVEGGILQDILSDIAIDELSLRRRLAGPVIEYDRLRQADLLKTLRSFIRHDLRRDETAVELSVHLNTLDFRLKRISDLSGLELRRVDTLFQVVLAISVLALSRDVELGTTLMPRRAAGAL